MEPHCALLCSKSCDHAIKSAQPRRLPWVIGGVCLLSKTCMFLCAVEEKGTWPVCLTVKRSKYIRPVFLPAVDIFNPSPILARGSVQDSDLPTLYLVSRTLQYHVQYHHEVNS